MPPGWPTMLGVWLSDEVIWGRPPKNTHDTYLEGALGKRRDDSQIGDALIDG
jgi:hypothetical protein